MQSRRSTVAAHPLDHVGEQVRRGELDRGRQVDDDLALGRRRPRPRSPRPRRAWRNQLGAGEHLGRVLGSGQSVSGCFSASSRIIRVPGRRPGRRSRRLAHAEHHVAHHRSNRVVEMDDGALGADQRFEGALDQRLARLRQHLDRHVVGNAALPRSAGARKSNSICDADGKPTSISLKPIFTSVWNMRSLRSNVHGLDQRLVAVAQVGAAARSAPCVSTASGQVRSRKPIGAKAGYLAGRLLSTWSFRSLKDYKKPATPKTKTARCWCKRAVESGVRVRYRLRPLADSSSASEIRFIRSM